MPVILSIPLPGPFRYVRRLRRPPGARRSRGQIAAAAVLGLTGAWFLVAAARLVLALYRPLIPACQLAWRTGRRASLRWPALDGWAWAFGIFTALGVADSPWWGVGSAAAGAVWLWRMRRRTGQREPADPDASDPRPGGVPS